MEKMKINDIESKNVDVDSIAGTSKGVDKEVFKNTVPTVNGYRDPIHVSSDENDEG